MRAEQSRADNIDILNAICAFLVVCIHVPFPSEVGAYYTTITRIAVPIFFMITGYFYADTKRRDKERNQIKKIFVLVVETNLLFFIWNIAFNFLKGDNIISYMQSIFSSKNLVKFLVLNVSPLAGHLWYLGAILYVRVIVMLMDIWKCRKGLYYLTPFLLITDIVFGKYSLLIFKYEFSYILVRNYLCVGIPYFCIGNLIKEKNVNEKWNKNILRVLLVIFSLTSVGERAVLVGIGANATRDHYISTTFLAVTLFVYVLNSSWNNKALAEIGRKYSTWIYIVHPIFISIFSVVTGKLGINAIYRCVAPILVYSVTIIFLIIMRKTKEMLRKK